MNLRPYQEEAIFNVFREWQIVNNTLIICPTGTGKTIIFSEITNRLVNSGKKVLVLAHREELLEQAQTKMGFFGIESSLEKAENHADISKDSVVVASIQSISRDERLLSYPSDFFDVIIIDEAHHAASDTYLKVINYFTNKKLLGVTATPNRADIRNITSIFETVAFTYNIRDAIMDEYLVPISIKRIPLTIDLSSVRTSCGDFMSGDLGDALTPYLELIADKLAEVALNRKTLIFTPTIAIGTQMAEILNDKGFRSACVSSKNTPTERKEILDKLHTGELNIVSNSMLLTEGFDEPSIDCIVNLRATKSEGLFTQIFGRGLRLSPETNKENLLYLDFLWHTDKGKYDVLSPINLFIDDSRIEDVNTILANGDTEDIFELEEKAKEMDIARTLLAERLKNASKKFFNGVEFIEHKSASLIYEYNGSELVSITIKDDDIVSFYTGSKEYEYIPYYSWEVEPTTEKQVEILIKLGFKLNNIPYKGLASRLINAAFTHKELGRCSYKQYSMLKKRNFVNVEKWATHEVLEMIDTLANNNWKLPYYIKPLKYIPLSLKRR